MTNTTINAEAKIKTDSIKFKTNKIFKGEHIFVTITLNDECKNGHQDFAITANIYEANKPPINNNMIGCGCCHDEILKAFPEFKIFVDLHLCDYKGIPMHPGANGYYHLRNGFNNTKIENPLFKNEYCEYYRITESQFNELSKTKNVLQFSLALQNLGILLQWEIQANEAIKLLENMSGCEFVNNSIKTQFVEPTKEQIEEEQQKQINGYYTPEAEQKREIEKQDKIIEKLKAERDKGINKYKLEFEVKKQVLLIGGSKALDNCIFYNHTNQLSFNWRGYDKLSEEFINTLVSKLKLPKGVTIKNENK